MKDNAITVRTTAAAGPEKTWHYYTEAEHVINWNFASKDWHCPKAVNDLRVGGDFTITMAAKSGEMHFDLEGTYDEVNAPKHIAYTLSNGRGVTVDFKKADEGTDVVVKFDPEDGQEMKPQKDGWQNILNNFREYVDRMEEAG